MLKLIIIGFILFLLIGGVLYFFLFKTTKDSNKDVKQYQTTEAETLKIINSHGDLYFADFEFNKNDNKYTFMDSGTTKGDTPFYDSQKPEVSPDTLPIRIRQVDKNNLLIMQGWDLLFLEALRPLEAPEGIYNFKVYVKYSPGSIIYLYDQEGKQVWLGTIE